MPFAVNGWNFPVGPGYTVTQQFSGGHPAVDLGVPEGTPVIAPGSGLIEAGYDPDGFGIFVRIEIDQRFEVILAHLSWTPGNPGETFEIQGGNLIGYSGNTGQSSGPHLHYEIREGASRLDPMADIWYWFPEFSAYPPGGPEGPDFYGATPGTSPAPGGGTAGGYPSPGSQSSPGGSSLKSSTGFDGLQVVFLVLAVLLLLAGATLLGLEEVLKASNPAPA